MLAEADRRVRRKRHAEVVKKRRGQGFDPDLSCLELPALDLPLAPEAPYPASVQVIARYRG
jgi:hypothetical protein